MTDNNGTNDWVSLPSAPLAAFLAGLDLDADAFMHATGVHTLEDVAGLNDSDLERAAQSFEPKLDLSKLRDGLARLRASLGKPAQAAQNSPDSASNLGDGKPTVGATSTTTPVAEATPAPEAAPALEEAKPLEEVTAIAIDRSGSMRSPLSTDRTRMEAVKQMFYAFRDRVDSLECDGGGRALGLLQFDHEAEVLLPPTTDLDSFEASVDHMKERGQTAIYSAITAAVRTLQPAFEASASTDLRIVALTDGQNNSGEPWESAARAARRIGAVVDAIIVGSSPDSGLRKIVTATGGQCFHIASLSAGFELLEAEAVVSLRARRGGRDKPPLALEGAEDSLDGVELATLNASTSVPRAPALAPAQAASKATSVHAAVRSAATHRGATRRAGCGAAAGDGAARALEEGALAEVREAFSLHATGGAAGELAREQLGDVLRALGVPAASEQQLSSMHAEARAASLPSSGVTLAGLVTVLSKRMLDTDSEEEVLAAFKALDTDGTGRLTHAQMRHVMSSLGEAVTDAEVSEMLRCADCDADGIADDGSVDYKEFVQMMLEDKAAPPPNAGLGLVSGGGGGGGAAGGGGGGGGGTAITNPSAPPAPCLRRVLKELRDLAAGSQRVWMHSGEGCHIFPTEGNLCLWRVLIEGPEGTPFAGGVFAAHVTIPEAYPFRPPKIVLDTPIFHPNVSDSGGLCLDILRDAWTPSLTVPKCVEAVRQLMRDPNPNDAMRHSIAELMLAHLKHGDADTRFVDRAREETAKHASRSVEEWRAAWGC